MTVQFGEFLFAGCLAGAAGLAALTLEPGWLGMLLVGLAVVGTVTMWRSGKSQGFMSVRWPVATALVALGVLTAAWTAIRGPGQFTASDLLFVVGLLGLGSIVIRGGAIPLPSWLIWAAAGLFFAFVLAELFVRHPPPPLVSPNIAPGSQVGTYATGLSTSSDVAAFLRIEFAMLLVPVLVGAVADSWRRADVFANLWLASAVVAAAVAVLDAFAGTGIGASLLNAQPSTREVGLTLQPNQLAVVCSMALPLAFARVGMNRGFGRLISVSATGLLLIGVLVSGSRLGVIAVLIAFMLSLLLLVDLRPKLVLASFVSLVLVLLAFSFGSPGGNGPVAWERLTGDDPGAQVATNSRFERIEESLSRAGDHPLTGLGFANLAGAHSIPVQLVMAGGAIALASFALFVFGTVRLGWSLARNPRVPRRSAQLAAALLAALGVWLLPGLINPQIVDRYLYVPVGVLLGLGLSARRDRSRAHGTGPGRVAQAEGKTLDEGRSPVPAGVSVP